MTIRRRPLILPKNYSEFCNVVYKNFCPGACPYSDFSGRDRGDDVSSLHSFAESINIIPMMNGQIIDLRQRRQQALCPCMVTVLSGGTPKAHGLAVSNSERMNFGVQASFCSSHALGKSPFLRRLDAVR